MDQEILRLPAEELFKKEIEALIAAERTRCPPAGKCLRVPCAPISAVGRWGIL